MMHWCLRCDSFSPRGCGLTCKRRYECEGVARRAKRFLRQNPRPTADQINAYLVSGRR